jgi:hypothetical protein
MPLDQIDQLIKECREEEFVMISVEVYKREQVIHNDGVIKEEEALVSSYGCGIRSSKDVFQFDDEDMKQLAPHVKKQLR